MPQDSTSRSDTLTVALLDSVNAAHAPTPTTDSERLLFRQLFGTLVRLDCNGETRPALAESWSGDSGGREWTFTLAKGARLPDGSPVTAPRVVSSWLARRDSVKELGIDSAVALDDRRLRVSLSATQASAPSLFAEPSLAVMSGLTSDRGMAFLVIPQRGSLPLHDFQYAPNGDPRDAIDRGVDLVVTRDPALADYVAGRPEFDTFSLPWSRTYVLLQPAAAETLHPMTAADSVGRSLARDAVRAYARRTELPFWSDGVAGCVAAPSIVETRPGTARIVYPTGDEVARGLAERIVALARDTRLRATPLSTAAFSAALRSGTERAYILSLPRQTLTPCREAAAWAPGARVQPLIDTRASAIVRRGAPQLSVDWDGTVWPVAAGDSSGDAR